MKTSFGKVAGLAVLLLSMLVLSFEAKGQACGYSTSTLYVQDQEGHPLRSVTITVRAKDPKDNDNSHFKERIHWDEERKAHVYQHGLCGSHRDLVLIVTAAGFEVAEHSIDLPFGEQAFELKLKRNGTGEIATFTSLPCSEDTNLCVRTILR